MIRQVALYWSAHNWEKTFWRNVIISPSSPSTLSSDNCLNAGANVCEKSVVYLSDGGDFENVKITSPRERFTSARAKRISLGPVSLLGDMALR